MSLLRIPERSPTIEEWQRKVRDAVNGMLRFTPGTVATVTADYTVPDDVSDIINNKSGSGMVLTLPDPAKYARREIAIKTLQAQTVASAASNVAPIGSASLGTAILPNTAGAWCRLKSNGAAWVVMARGT
jgi:hypothetical protein